MNQFSIVYLGPFDRAPFFGGTFWFDKDVPQAVRGDLAAQLLFTKNTDGSQQFQLASEADFNGMLADGFIAAGTPIDGLVWSNGSRAVAPADQTLVPPDGTVNPSQAVLASNDGTNSGNDGTNTGNGDSNAGNDGTSDSGAGDGGTGDSSTDDDGDGETDSEADANGGDTNTAGADGANTNPATPKSTGRRPRNTGAQA